MPRIVGLDLIQRGDALQGLQRQRRTLGRMQVEELPPTVRHTGRFGHPALVEPGITGVPVRLKDAAESGEMASRMLAFAVRAVVVQHRRRRRAGERTIIAHVTPQPAGAGL